MKTRKILISLLLVAVMVMSVCLSACDILLEIGGFGSGGGNSNSNGNGGGGSGGADEVNHNYSTEWEADDDYHWHECTDKDCTETSGKSAHIYGGWVLDEFSTATINGKRHRQCATCQHTQIDELPTIDGSHQHSSEYGLWEKYDETYHSAVCFCGAGDTSKLYPHEMSDWVIDWAATTEQPGQKSQTCTLCGYTATAVIPQLPPDITRTLDLYAINDFHGEWAKMSQISGYLSQQKALGNTLLLNSGDMFQGSMESNSNFGALLAACMDETHFDAFTYGNHEFDWGLDNLRTLAANSQTPYLGANIYNWDRQKGWGTLADFAQEYVIKELDNGLKVGIIGIIGKDQITSISSQLVQTIGFKDPKEVVPNISNKLRNQLGCDVVIVSAHTGEETFLTDYTWDITQYADAVFCAHTHQSEISVKNGVPFIQTNGYGRQVSYVSLSVTSRGNVSCNVRENIYFDGSWPNKFSVSEMIDNSNASIAEEANRVLATLNGGNLNSSTAVPRLVAHAIADYATSQGYDIELAMVNNARSYLYRGEITYTALYEAIPFDNVVYVAEVSGKDILNEAGYSSNSIWRVKSTKIEDSSTKYYKIAVLDYLLYHQNANRNYNYFASAFTAGRPDPIPLTKAGVDAYNYRLITRDWLLEQGTIDASTYSEVNSHTNKDLLKQTITFALAGNFATQICTSPMGLIGSSAMLFA